MAFFCAMLILSSLLVFSLVFIKPKNELASWLNDFLNSFKKRKFGENNVKNTTKTAKSGKNTQSLAGLKFKYKRLKPVHLSRKIRLEKSKAKKIYVEWQAEGQAQELKKIASILEKEINLNSAKFRAADSKTVVEHLADFFASQILIKPSFNVFEAFSELAKELKIYKKEAHVLGALIAASLIRIYIKLQKDVLNIKRLALAGARVKRLKKNSPSALVYGVYMFNKNSTKLLTKTNQSIIAATSAVLNELDSTFSKQCIIFNYIRYIYNKY